MFQYHMPLYRPPSEAASLLIQVTYGCPHNKCAFCPMYKNVKFKVRPLDEVLMEIDLAAKTYKDQVRTVFLPDGNTIVLKTEKLLPILERITQSFPNLQRITCYGSARYILKKSEEELLKLRKAGLKRIHMGIESGDREVLEKIQKGADPEQMIQGGQRVKKAGIEISEYVLVGVAGPEKSQDHARESARVLNAIEPDFVRLRTYVPVPGTPLGDAHEAGDFVLLSPHECLREIKTLVEHLEGRMELCSDHISNYANVQGVVPEDKKAILSKINKLLDLDEENFRDHLMGYQL